LLPPHVTTRTFVPPSSDSHVPSGDAANAALDMAYNASVAAPTNFIQTSILFPADPYNAMRVQAGEHEIAGWLVAAEKARLAMYQRPPKYAICGSSSAYFVGASPRRARCSRSIHCII
jgi:hypothetical protein